MLHLFRRTPQITVIASLYGAIVAQARTAAFYRDYDVPDTVNGRFEMIVLHAVLLLHRLEPESAPERTLGQGVFDRFCRDMDANLREMGVGDIAVPRSMRRIGEAFYGRQKAYAAALAVSGERALVQALARNVFASPAAAGAPRLAAYVRAVVGHLARQDAAAIGRGELDFPNPAAIAEKTLPPTVIHDDATPS